MTKEIKPCMFCGSKDVSLVDCDYWQCGRCGAAGPDRDIGGEKWNAAPRDVPLFTAEIDSADDDQMTIDRATEAISALSQNAYWNSNGEPLNKSAEAYDSIALWLKRKIQGQEAGQ